MQYHKIFKVEKFPYPLSSVSLPSSFKVLFYFHDKMGSSEVQCEIDTTLIEAANRALRPSTPLTFEGYSIGDYVVKLKGTNTFFFEDGILSSFTHIREDINAKRTPKFVLLPKFQEIQDKLDAFIKNESMVRII